MNFDYQKICHGLLKDLPARAKEILKNRFGLEDEERKTLEAIGENFGITRERVRQIEEDGILKIKPKLKRYQEVFQYFLEELKFFGNFRREDKFLQKLADSPKFQNHTFFLLNLVDNFKRFPQNEEFYSLWTIDLDSLILAKGVINLFSQKLSELNHPISLEEFKLPPVHPWAKIDEDIQRRWLGSTTEISKKIKIGFEGLYGLNEWPEINLKRIKDKIYLTLKREKRPIHFRELTDLVNKNFYGVNKLALPQTVHNELIRDPKFVLVGRGIYGLKEWGYEGGQVRNIILKVLKDAQRPLFKEEILELVLKQKMVKKSTILFNLSNKKYFLKNSEGKYIISEFKNSDAM